MSNFWLQLSNNCDACLWEGGVDQFYSPSQNLDVINPDQYHMNDSTDK